MTFSKPVFEIIRHRFSCRTYDGQLVPQKTRQWLTDFLAILRQGPLGSRVRFSFIAATEQESRSLKGLGTYGLIQGAKAYIAGAVNGSAKDLEDFGYIMELIVLFATDLGLGTCWLGGSFTRSGFSKQVRPDDTEQMPAVISIGCMKDQEKARKGWVRRRAKSDMRLEWGQLFFDSAFGVPLTQESAGAYATPLEMVRLGPSASNKQPWRIVKNDAGYHFYLHRTKGYPPAVARKLLNIADIQRLDMGIAMCHFELCAQESGLAGRWKTQVPDIVKPDNLTEEYTVSWVC